MNQHSSTDSRNKHSPLLLVQVTISLQATQCDACVSCARSIFASRFALGSLSLHQRYSLHTRLVFAVWTNYSARFVRNAVECQFLVTDFYNIKVLVRLDSSVPDQVAILKSPSVQLTDHSSLVV